MNPKKVIAVLLVFVPALCLAAGRECIDWPRIMSRQTAGDATEGKIVVVESFTDYTKQAGDEWLSAGLRELSASMLAAGNNLRVFSGLSAVYNTDAKNPAFAVSGMFQHLEGGPARLASEPEARVAGGPARLASEPEARVAGGLRIFVKLMRRGELISQYEVLVPYPESSEIFTRLADVTKQIWKVMEVGGDESRLNAVRDATLSTRAYESYIKGKLSLETYKINEMEVAKTWFGEAKRADYRSPLGYQGMIDLYTFLGFYHKQRREPFGSYFEQAERELADMNRLAKRPPPVVLTVKKPAKKEKGSSAKLQNRFLLNHASFKEGIIAADAGNMQAAAGAFKKALEYVPEDAISWYHLARIYENLGNTAESTKALQKAYEVNPCIEK